MITKYVHIWFARCVAINVLCAVKRANFVNSRVHKLWLQTFSY